ncbi:hypothetical protein [Noviherbaspirillum autotrophicum]|uniref:hypothetical protein n=1 Tax=Noviherbaspirillum autotrophicum TaxID=709839 RepID=UPI000A8B4956|nr:hypothetical protein [Noviherbaspirillum autotrophicum]
MTTQSKALFLALPITSAFAAPATVAADAVKMPFVDPFSGPRTPVKRGILTS